MNNNNKQLASCNNMQYKMKNIILISECFEKVEIGYVSTFVRMDRTNNEVLSVTYHWHEKISSNNGKEFNSFESLNVFLNELIDLKNKCELNSLENQSNEQ